MLRGSRAGQLFGSCSLGLSFISSIVFTSASPSASFPAAGSLLLNHCSAQQLPGTGSMPRLDGGSKSRLQTSLCLFSFSNFLNFFFFFLILLNLPVLPHRFPFLPFGCRALLALEACSDTWLLAAWGLAVAGIVQLLIGNGRRAGITARVRATHRGYQGCAGGHLYLLLASWWLFTTHIPLALPAALAKAVSGSAEDF